MPSKHYDTPTRARVRGVVEYLEAHGLLGSKPHTKHHVFEFFGVKKTQGYEIIKGKDRGGETAEDAQEDAPGDDDPETNAAGPESPTPKRKAPAPEGASNAKRARNSGGRVEDTDSRRFHNDPTRKETRGRKKSTTTTPKAKVTKKTPKPKTSKPAETFDSRTFTLEGGVPNRPPLTLPEQDAAFHGGAIGRMMGLDPNPGDPSNFQAPNPGDPGEV